MYPSNRRFLVQLLLACLVLFTAGCQGAVQSRDQSLGTPPRVGSSPAPIKGGGQSEISSLAETLKSLRRGLADQEQRIDEGRRSVQELTDQIEKNRNSIEEIWKKFDLQTKELKERLDSMENEFARLRSPGDRSDTRSGDKSREERFPPVVRPGETPPSGSPKVDVGTEKEPGTQSVGIPSVTPGGTGSSVPPAGSPQPGPQVSKTQKPKPELDFDEALKVFRKDRSFPRARFLLNQFISNYPNHDLADDAQYLIGESYFEEKNFERAILAFNKVQVDYANGDKAPDALLKEALAFLNLGDKASAGELLGRVVQKYPESEAAKVATERLNSL